MNFFKIIIRRRYYYCVPLCVNFVVVVVVCGKTALYLFEFGLRIFHGG